MTRQTKAKAESFEAGRFLKPVLIGTAVGAVTITIVLMLLSVAFSLWDVPQMAVTPMVIAALAVGAFCGGWFAARLLREKGIWVGLVCGALLFALLWVCGLKVNAGGMGLMAVIKLAAALICGGLGGIVGVNAKKKRK